MAFFEAVRMALEALRGNRLRSALTLLGMVIGVFAIIVSVTAVKVIDVYFNEKLDFLGASTFTISQYPVIRIEGGRSSRNRPPITYEQVERLERSMRTPVALGVIEDFSFGAVRYQDRETEPNMVLIGADENLLANYSYDLQSGRYITEEDVRFGRPVAVLLEDAVDVLFPNESPLGKEIRFRGHRFEVIGVLENQGSFLGFNQNTRLFIPITRGMTLYGNPNRNIANISVRVTNSQQMESAMEEATGRMRVIRGVGPGEDNNFEIGTNDSIGRIFDAFTGTLTTAGAGIGLIALLAAGIGIMNIMLVSVTERTREIGIRKSIGARRKDVMRQFLTEAFVLCQIGGLLGILLGALVGNLTAVYFEISAAFPVNWAIGAVVMVTIISLVFGGYPALKAARLNPIDALRYE
ncbi:MAG: ABC transporter permease [Rhodothermales bacterium]|nr:ABC transporter permease [Rhodothermales bacterium]MBO6779503.1 ABC transporter permease [Rhodothermales bacterium]